MLFQFTRPRGARPPVALCLRTRHRFNSRAHEGRDAIRLNAAGLRVVSIHAPTRGATKMKISYIKLAIVSIHAPTRGATAGGLLLHPRANRFNSRAHEGRDGDRDRLGQGGLCFNSRAHEGRDTYHQKLTGEIAVSIHAPTRGATGGRRRVVVEPLVSIHAPTRGATALHQNRNRLQAVSIHAPTRGATAYILSYPIVGPQGGFPRTLAVFWIVFSYCQ